MLEALLSNQSVPMGWWITG